MAAVEGELWWYRALHHLVAAALGRHPRGRDCRLLDAGCGTGGLLRFLRGEGYARLAGFDLSPHAVRMARSRGLPVEPGDLRRFGWRAGDEKWDVIVSNDTLYFLEPAEQQEAVENLRRALAPEGWLILNLPALRAFRGSHDQAVGIGRRFSKTDVARLLPAPRFTILEARYWPFVLSPLIYVVRSRQRWRMRRGTTERGVSDLWLPPRLLNRGLELLVRAENAALAWKPWGSSLFLVGRKRPEQSEAEGPGSEVGECAGRIPERSRSARAHPRQAARAERGEPSHLRSHFTVPRGSTRAPAFGRGPVSAS